VVTAHYSFSPHTRSTIAGVECQEAYPKTALLSLAKFTRYAPGTTYDCVTDANTNAANNLTILLANRAKLNTVHPLPSVTFPASALIPMARRSGMPAVVRAYDAGMSLPAVRS